MVVVTGPLRKELGDRKVVGFGASLVAVAIMLCTVCESTGSLLFLYAIVGG